MPGKSDNDTVKRVLVVDDHPLICKGLVQIINDEKDLTACGVADDANAALKLIAEKEPHAVIVDISLKSSSGLELIKAMAARYPGLPALVYSMHDESVFAERALRVGAKGYVMKDQPPEVLIGALRKILGGSIYFSDAVLTRIVGRLVAAGPRGEGQPTQSLTDRELEILQLVGQELKNGQIAKKLNISIKTVETHREHIRKKLGLNSAHELSEYAKEWFQGGNDTAAG